MDTSQTATLKDLRKAKGLTLVQLSRACGVSHGNLSRIERGQEGVTVHRVCAIAAGLGEAEERVFTAIVAAARAGRGEATPHRGASAPG